MNSTLLNLLNELDKQFFIKSMSIFDKSVQVILIQEKDVSAVRLINTNHNKHKDTYRNKEEE